MKALLFAACVLVSTPALASLDSPSAVTMAAIQAIMPQPATTAPPPDTLNGTAGVTPMVYALSTHTHPRVSYSPVAISNAVTGVFSGTFPDGFFASAPTIALTWESASTLVSCQLTAGTITATAYAGKCALLAGLLPAGNITVHVVAIPRN